MRIRIGELSFSHGTWTTELELGDNYSSLSEEAQNRLREAAMAVYLDLDTTLHYVQGRQAGMVDEGQSFTGITGEGKDIIKAFVTITDTKSAVPQPVAQDFASKVARTVQNHADSIRYGIPASSDTLVQLQTYKSLEIQAAYGSEEFDGFMSDELVGASHGGGSGQQPRRPGSAPRSTR